MHVVTINEHKIAIFWTAKTGHSTMHKIIKDNFTPNANKGWQSHTQNIPHDISDFTFILLYRNPIERLVSSFFMNQVPENISFKEFVLNFDNFKDHHQTRQAVEPGLSIFKKSNKKFDYMINTKNLNELPILLEKLTGKNIQKNVGENMLKRTNEDLDIDYFNIKKSNFNNNKIGIPKWEKFYNKELKIIAMNSLKLDYEFFESIGIKF